MYCCWDHRRTFLRFLKKWNLATRNWHWLPHAVNEDKQLPTSCHLTREHTKVLRNMTYENIVVLEAVRTTPMRLSQLALWNFERCYPNLVSRISRRKMVVPSVLMQSIMMHEHTKKWVLAAENRRWHRKMVILTDRLAGLNVKHTCLTWNLWLRRAFGPKSKYLTRNRWYIISTNGLSKSREEIQKRFNFFRHSSLWCVSTSAGPLK